jgi:hypothetical protein
MIGIGEHNLVGMEWRNCYIYAEDLCGNQLYAGFRKSGYV